jgi:hypothetical protein
MTPVAATATASTPTSGSQNSDTFDNAHSQGYINLAMTTQTIGCTQVFINFHKAPESTLIAFKAECPGSAMFPLHPLRLSS